MARRPPLSAAACAAWHELNWFDCGAPTEGGENSCLHPLTLAPRLEFACNGICQDGFFGDVFSDASIQLAVGISCEYATGKPHWRAP